MGFKYVGDSNQLLFQFESGTYGNASGTRQWIGLVQDHSPDEGAGVESIRFQGNYSRNPGLFIDGKLEYGGTFTYYPQDFKFLALAIGSVSSTGSPAYTHTITETNSDSSNYAIPNQSLSSFTLEDAKKTPNVGSNFIRTFKGCIVDSFKINIAEGEISSCDVGYMAQNVVFSSGAVTSLSPRTVKPYMWSNVTLHMPSGTRLTNCTEYSLTINNNLERRFPLNGSRVIEEVYPGNRDYTIDATFIMDTANAKQLYDAYYIGGSSFNSLIEIKAVAGSAYISLSGCRITDMGVPSPVEGLQEQSCTIQPTSVSAIVYDAISNYSYNL
jgi:hypothetical protein